jgi:hypothetical protein
MSTIRIYRVSRARCSTSSQGQQFCSQLQLERLEDRLVPSIVDGTILVTTAPSPLANQSQSSFPTGIISVNPGTGAQTGLSTGGLFSLPTYVAEAPNQQLYVTDLTAFGTGAVFRVDSITGQQNLVAKGGMINGPNVITFIGGNLYVANGGDSSGSVHTLVRIDPNTGQQTLVTDGSSGGFTVPVGMVPAPGNSVYVVDEPGNFQGSDPGKLWEVNLSTGQQSLVSSNNVVQGKLFDHPVDVAVDATGNIIVANTGGPADNVAGSVFRADPKTGVQTLITRFGAFSGTNSLEIGLGGTIFVGAIADGPAPGQIIAVDPVTGVQNVLTSGGNLSEVEGLRVFKTVVPTVPTTVAISSSANPTVFGEMVTFTATVTTSAPAGSTPTGTVQFVIDGKNVGSPLGVNASDGVITASLSIASLIVGTHTVAVNYSGDASFAASEGALIGGQSVGKARATTTLTSSANPSASGQLVGFTAIVTAATPDAGTPTGTVQFVIDSTNAGNPVRVSPGGGGTATSSSTAGVTNDSPPTLAADSSEPAVTTMSGETAETSDDGSAAFVTSGLPIGRHSVAAVYSGDSNLTESNSAVLSQAVGTPDERFVAQAYLDLLERPVDPVGLASWTALLAGAASRTQVVAAIEASQEYETDLVQNLYSLYLHRIGEDAGVRYWLAILQAGGSVTEIRAGFVGSPEYFQARGNGTNEGFLNALYQDALNRFVDPSGQNSWSLILSQAQLSRINVGGAVFSSREYRQDLVESFYEQFLHRPADQGGLDTFVGDLETGATESILIAALLGSDEYLDGCNC